jgi:hypothetical protein
LSRNYQRKENSNKREKSKQKPGVGTAYRN